MSSIYNVIILIAFISVSLFMDFLYTPVTGKELTNAKRFMLLIGISLFFILLIFITP